MGITKRIQINHPKGLKLEKCGLVLALLPPTDKQAHIVMYKYQVPADVTLKP